MRDVLFDLSTPHTPESGSRAWPGHQEPRRSPHVTTPGSRHRAPHSCQFAAFKLTTQESDSLQTDSRPAAALRPRVTRPDQRRTSAHPRSNLSDVGSDALTLFLIPSRPAPRTPTRPLLPSDSLSDSDRSCRRRAASSRSHPFCCHARRRNASPQRPLLPRETLILLPDDQRLPLGLHGRPGAHRRRLIKVGGHETYE